MKVMMLIFYNFDGDMNEVSKGDADYDTDNFDSLKS